MAVIFQNMLILIKNNIYILISALMVFFVLSLAALPYQIESFIVMLLSLYLYLRLLNQKRTTFKVVAKYVAIYAIAYLICLLIASVLAMAFTLATVSLALYSSKFEPFLYLARDFELNFFFGAVIGLYILARIRLILPFVLIANEASIRELIKKSSIGSFKLLIFAIVFYTPILIMEYQMVKHLMLRGIALQLLFAVTIPLICIFNVAFYMSKQSSAT